jgi:O-antigen ligase
MSDRIIPCFLVILVIFSCLIYGSVTAASFFITQIIIIIAVLAWMVDALLLKAELSFVKAGFPLYLILVLFLCLVFFQILPLPRSLLEVISPATVNLFNNFLPVGNKAGFLTVSVYPQDTASELLWLTGLFAIFFLTVNKLKTKRQFDELINAIILFGFFISVFGIIQKYTYSGRVYWFDPPDSAGGAFGPFANRNNFSGYINMIMPLTLGYFLTDMPLAKRLLYAFFLLVMSLALFLTLSRGGLIIYFATVLFLFVLSGVNSKLRFGSRILSGGILFLCSLYLLLGEAKVAWVRVLTLFSKNTFVVLGHGYSWIDILRIWKDFPLFGTGLGTFGNISAMYKSTPAQSLFIYAHNDYLQLLSEVGVAGFTLMLFFFISYFVLVLRNWLRRRDSYVACVVLGGIASVFSMLVYSLLDFNLHIPASALLFFVILGLVFRLSYSHFEHAKPLS